MKLQLPAQMALFIFNFCVFSSCTSRSTPPEPTKITGTIKISPEIATKVKPTDVLYIIARREQIGPPAAVKRIVAPAFPLKYTIGPEDAMMAGIGGFEQGGNLTIAARLSRTGNAMPASGDLEGVYPKNPAHPGNDSIDVTIDRERQ